MKVSKKSQRLYRRVENEIKRIGIVSVMIKLGYRSPSFFTKWRQSESVPSCAIQKVEAYFKAKNGGVLLEGP